MKVHAWNTEDVKFENENEDANLVKRLTYVISSALRRLIEQCCHQLSSSDVSLPEHRRFLAEVEQRLRKLLSLLEKGNESVFEAFEGEKGGGGVISSLGGGGDGEELNEVKLEESYLFEADAVETSHNLNHEQSSYHKGENDFSEQCPQMENLISQTIESRRTKTKGFCKYGQQPESTPRGDSYDDGDADFCHLGTEVEDDDYLPPSILNKRPVNVRSPPRRNNNNKNDKNDRDKDGKEKWWNKATRRKRLPSSFSSPLSTCDDNNISVISGFQIESEEAVSKCKKRKKITPQTPEPHDADDALTISAPTLDERETELLTRLTIATFSDVYRRLSTDATEVNGSAAKGGITENGEINCDRHNTRNDAESDPSPGNEDSFGEVGTEMECRACALTFPMRDLLQHHRNHARKERTWRMRNRIGKRVDHLDFNKSRCPWCQLKFIDGRGCAANNGESKSTVDTSLSNPGNSAGAEGLKSNLLCHIFEHHGNVEVEEIETRGIDPVVVVSLGPDAVALDFKTRNCYCLRCYSSHASVDACGNHFVEAHRPTDGNDEAICLVCDKLFDSTSRLKRHQRLVHRKENVPCSICGKLFTNRQWARRHQKVVHSEKKVTCETCGKSYSYEVNLRRHQRRVHGEGQNQIYACDICGKSYANLPSLHYHKSSLHLKRRFACNLCDVTYHQRSALNAHVKKVHEGIIDRKSCQLCSRQFTGNSALKKHLESTHGSKKFPCATCGKEFSRQGGLHAHVTSAHLGKRYECDSCDKSFTQSGTLAAHKRNHHGK